MADLRYPLIALDYSQKDKAVKKEILIDYNTGNIYVVSATDKTIIFDVTSKILEKISDISSENITVIIEGVGEVNLTEFLKQLKLSIDNTVQIKDPGNDFSYIIKDNTLDNKSIKIFNSQIQLDNYSNADSQSIPQKTSTGLRWMPLEELIAGLTPPINPDGGYDETDGNLKKVPYVVNQNNKIYLSSRVQKSLNLTDSIANVYLPATVDEYSVIKWKLEQKDEDITLYFENNVIFERQMFTSNELYLTASDVIMVFVFETYDYGKTWLCKIEGYNIPNTSGIPIDPPSGGGEVS